MAIPLICSGVVVINIMPESEKGLLTFAGAVVCFNWSLATFFLIMAHKENQGSENEEK